MVETHNNIHALGFILSKLEKKKSILDKNCWSKLHRSRLTQLECCQDKLRCKLVVSFFGIIFIVKVIYLFWSM